MECDKWLAEKKATDKTNKQQRDKSKFTAHENQFVNASLRGGV